MRLQLKNWMLYLFLIVCVFLPIITTVPFSPWESGLVAKEVFQTTGALYPLWLRITLHLVTLLLLVLLYQYGQSLNRVIAAFFGFLFLFQAFSQHITITPSYGLAILTGNVVIIAVVGLFWLWEAYRPHNEYTFHRLPWWRYWSIPFVILAYWFPYGPDLQPSLDPFLLLTSDFGVMFCPTAPLIIALLTFIYPQVDKRLLTVTSFVGFIIALLNIIAPLTIPGYSLWMLFLHTPLICISLYGLILPRLVKTSAIPIEP